MKKLLSLLAFVLVITTLSAQNSKLISVALLNVENQTLVGDEEIVFAVREIMVSAIVNSGKYNVVEHEHAIDLNTPMSIEQIVEIGQLLNVQKVLAPSAKKVGDKIMFTIKLIDVSSSFTERQKVKIIHQSEIFDVIESLTQDAIGLNEIAVSGSHQVADMTPVSAAVGNSQNMNSDVYVPTGGVVMYGVDFSKVQIAGTDSTSVNYARAFKRINAIFDLEPDKYDFADLSRRKVVNYTVPTDMMVDAIDWNYAMQGGTEPKKYSVAEMIKKYQLPHTTGMGMVIIAWLLDEANATGHYEIVYFDIATRKIILNTSVVALAGGLKLRNFWANSIYEAINQKELRRYVKQILSTYKNYVTVH